MKNEFLNQINTYLPNVDYCSFRFVNKYTNILSVTRNVLEPIEIVEDDVEIEEELEIEDTEVDEDTQVEIIEIVEEEEVAEPEIFSIVEDMPSFPGGEAKLFEYLGKSIKYPAMAKDKF